MVFELERHHPHLRRCACAGGGADQGLRGPPLRLRPHAPAQGPPVPKDRLRFPPGDDGYAKQHPGEVVSCRGVVGATMTVDCGCGVGLEHCVPGDGFGNEPRAFTLPTHFPLGADAPFDTQPQGHVRVDTSSGGRSEARHFMNRLFGEDRDFREVLTGRWSFVNGPLAEFYRSGARSSCCGRERAFKMAEESDPLFAAGSVPKGLLPMDATHWSLVPDRGPRAAGLHSLAMPVFLAKYASRRARGAAVYQAFLCKSFVADHVDLEALHPGPADGHARAAPPAMQPSSRSPRLLAGGGDELGLPSCPSSSRWGAEVCKKKNAQGKMPGFCDFFYDAAFSDQKAGKLRGAYASPDHSERGPAALAADVTARPEFASCAVERVTSSFLGRQLRDDDQKLVDSLRADFVSHGYRMRSLVGALVRSRAYLSAQRRSLVVPPSTLSRRGTPRSPTRPSRSRGLRERLAALPAIACLVTGRTSSRGRAPVARGTAARGGTHGRGCDAQAGSASSSRQRRTSAPTSSSSQARSLEVQRPRARRRRRHALRHLGRLPLGAGLPRLPARSPPQGPRPTR